MFNNTESVYRRLTGKYSGDHEHQGKFDPKLIPEAARKAYEAALKQSNEETVTDKNEIKGSGSTARQ